MNKLQSLFARILREPLSNITESISPKTLSSWDSLHHVELIMEIEDVYKVIFTTAEIIGLTSLARVREVLQSKVAAA
jgi:acyl carrier protein